MNPQKIARLETLLDRKLDPEEKERLRRVKDTLGISDNDALWDVLTAMEYQRKYYDELPEKISRAAEEIINNLSQATEKEVALARSCLAESVVDQARKLAQKTHLHAWFKWGTLVIVLLLLYSGLLLWAGFSIGSGQTHPPALLLRMPVGVIIGALCFACSIFFGALAAIDFSEGNTNWHKRLLLTVGCLLPGGGIFAATLV